MADMCTDEVDNLLLARSATAFGAASSRIKDR